MQAEEKKIEKNDVDQKSDEDNEATVTLTKSQLVEIIGRSILQYVNQRPIDWICAKAISEDWSQYVFDAVNGKSGAK